jgi:hypothetical protein
MYQIESQKPSSPQEETTEMILRRLRATFKHLKALTMEGYQDLFFCFQRIIMIRIPFIINFSPVSHHARAFNTLSPILTSTTK